jgi:cation diffusion facilitator CzcD-associated flavoprotein CzcO
MCVSIGADTKYYADSGQIHRYLSSVADKYSARKFMKFRQSVKSLKWDNQMGLYTIEIEVRPKDELAGNSFATHLCVLRRRI